ncbi:hypothetical protein H5410_031924, partial [Solanum commersonii]
IRSQRPEDIIKVSPNDALGIVLGPEYPGHVRGLGLGVVPTVAFKQTSGRFMYVDQRNIGNILEEFAYLFPPPP